MVINEEQAEIVRWMFAQALAGKGTHKIASELNERGVPTRKGGNWTATTVRGLLANEKFTGDILFQKTYTDSQFNRHHNNGERDRYFMEDHHPAIVNASAPTICCFLKWRQTRFPQGCSKWRASALLPSTACSDFPFQNKRKPRCRAAAGQAPGSPACSVKNG